MQRGVRPTVAFACSRPRSSIPEHSAHRAKPPLPNLGAQSQPTGHDSTVHCPPEVVRGIEQAPNKQNGVRVLRHRHLVPGLACTSARPEPAVIAKHCLCALPWWNPPPPSLLELILSQARKLFLAESPTNLVTGRRVDVRNLKVRSCGSQINLPPLHCSKLA